MEHALSVHRPGSRRPPQGTARRSSAVQRLTALAIALVFTGFVGSLGLFTATRADIAQRIIARALPTITELDGLLALHAAELQARAKADPGRPVVFPEFPINVGLPAALVAQAGPQRLAQLLTSRAATAVYERGAAAFAFPEERPTSQTGPLLSSAWAMHQSLGLLNARSHARFARTTLLLGLLVLGLVGAFCLQVGGYGRLVGLGVSGIAAALLAGLVTLAAWLFVQLNYGSANSPLGAAAWGMIADSIWTLVLVDLVVGASCAALALTGYLFARVDSQGSSEPGTSFEEPTVPAVVPAGRGGRPLDRLPKPPPPAGGRL